MYPRCRSAALLAAVVVGVLMAAAAGAQEPAIQAEHLASIRVHGNYATPDNVVLSLAALTVGQALTPESTAEARQRLDASGRFEGVEIRKRYQSLSDPTAVALVIVVREREGATPDDPQPGPLRRFTGRLMFLPILTFEDGYGFTYGGRVTVANAIGKGFRLTAPLTWGGIRQAAIEADRPFATGLISRVRFGAYIHQRENPHYEVDDQRRQAWFEIAAVPVRFVQLGASTSVALIRYGDADDRLATIGASLALDTRQNASFPRNALFARVAWTALRVEGLDTVNRVEPDVQAYVGLIRSSILVLRAQGSLVDRAIPPYEQALLGGTSSLRGFRTGYRAADNVLAGTVELRIPLNSPMRFANTGLRVFADTGTTWNRGEHLKDSRADTGVGVGWFAIAPLFQFGIDVAHGLDAGTRAHVTFGIRF
ncbi:MAG: BamA/TamA family outer membrane protein [Acidobacteriota bacterium]